MEVLSTKINKAIDQRHWMPIQITCGGPSVSHLFFADDLLLFREATNQQVSVIEDILRTLCNISGQSISVKKSQVLLPKNVASNLNLQLFIRLGIGVITNFGKYLGVLLLHGRGSRHDYNYILDKVRSRLEAWQIQYLSQAARCTLIQSVLTSMPLYIMQMVRVPIGLIEDIEKLMRRSIWGKTDQLRKIHWCSWEVIYQPKDRGGLGLLCPRDINLAMLAKLGWCFLTQPNALWVRILRAKYGDILGA